MGSFRIAALLILALGFAPMARPHDIPADVTVQTFIKPAGKTLTLVVRVPIKAMRDVCGGGKCSIVTTGALPTFGIK